jgi:hypothetical protein
MGRHRRHNKRGRTSPTGMILIRHGEESVEVLARLCQIFGDRIAREAWSELAVVTHWGFIKAVKGLSVAKGAAPRIGRLNPIVQRNCSICRTA